MKRYVAIVLVGFLAVSSAMAGDLALEAEDSQ